MKPEDLWEKDDLTSMNDLIRLDRFIKSCGTKSAQVWSAWYNLKEELKAFRAALDKSGNTAPNTLKAEIAAIADGLADYSRTNGHYFVDRFVTRLRRLSAV